MKRLSWLCWVSGFLAGVVLGDGARAEAWSLSDQQRRDYLGYYSPIIFKEADEGRRRNFGYDWVTNFDFDRDGVFSNNKQNWEDVGTYVSARGGSSPGVGPDREQWRIRPTLYTAILEFMQNGRKSAILLYHVYHAKQQHSIHDWERVEIRIDGLSGRPGTGDEQVNYVVITQHSLHNRRVFERAELNFMETGFGKHVMVWQAAWSDALVIKKSELRWIEHSFRSLDRYIRRDRSARVNISGTGKRRQVGYVFLCDCDPEAVAYWNAGAITYDNAFDMAAKTSASSSERRKWSELPRATYELQDIADILPTHLSGNRPYLHWNKRSVTILLESPILSETGRELVSPGVQKFYHGAFDREDVTEARKGYPDKHWFWGTYLFGKRGSFSRYEDDLGVPAGFGGPTDRGGITRSRRARDNGFRRQHDYFAHDGVDGDGTGRGEKGEWLSDGWYSASRGGFDGRWVQLFADEPVRPATPAQPAVAATSAPTPDSPELHKASFDSAAANCVVLAAGVAGSLADGSVGPVCQ